MRKLLVWIKDFVVCEFFDSQVLHWKVEMQNAEG